MRGQASQPETLYFDLRQMGNVDVRVNYNIFDTLIRRDFLKEAKTGEMHLVPGLATWLPNQVDR